jgi:hypothetical protein
MPAAPVTDVHRAKLALEEQRLRAADRGHELVGQGFQRASSGRTRTAGESLEQARRTDVKPAAEVAVENPREDRPRVEAVEARPLDRPVTGHERT